MSVKPEAFEDIKTANVFHHPVKAKSEFQYLYLRFILSIKYQIFNCTYHCSFSCYLTINQT